ncbi:MAG: hypothetical protein JWP01_103 [Myxococcales bacterium]|nr:hypothetical protein [Myxococcales bacterium]
MACTQELRSGVWSASVLTSATVLVVDDNAENRALARAALEDEGYRVVLATDGTTGIAAFQQHHPDCILLDVRMPGVDGLTACEQIRALPGGETVAIVFVTAQREVETFDRAIAAGGDDFLTKPFRPSELVVRVQAALRARKLAGERSGLFEQVKRQRDDLQRLQLHKEQLTNFLVHDLKNPVSTIELQVQRVLRDPGATDRSRSAANAICDEARALMRMILNLLDVSRADEGRLMPVCQRLDTETIIRAALDDMQLRAAASQVALRADVGAATVDADPGLIHRVLTNLVENAIRYAPEGTAVTVTTRPLAGATQIRICDAGPGIPPEQRAQVFHRFESGRGTTTENRGLGLAFCKLAVEAHGGTISIEDAAPGAVFCLRFPDVPD